MRDRLYAPKAFGKDADDVEWYVWELAKYVAAHTHQRVDEVAERLFRLIGWMCARKETDGRD